ncbi:YesL family protein [Neobacillus muris]|uniref:YesL family protein n=1 Tax=Neobacillus muris TaxID=2941334 RepID=UPI00203D0578|nr:YesL family protein [Neobacillus muris]
MKQTNMFGEGKFFGIANLIYGLLMTNIYFVFSNILFLFFFMALQPSISNLTIYFLALIPTGPAISALFYSLGKLIREKELSPLRDFFYGYKINFKDTLKFWLPFLAVLFILLVDLHYFNSKGSILYLILSVVFLVAIIVLLVLTLNAFLINAGFVFRTKDLWKLSVYYSFKKRKVTFGNIGIVIITLFLSAVTTDFLVVLAASLIGYVFLVNSKDLLEDIQQNFCKPEDGLKQKTV